MFPAGPMLLLERENPIAELLFWVIVGLRSSPHHECTTNYTPKDGLPDAVYNTSEELAHPNTETAHPREM